MVEQNRNRVVLWVMSVLTIVLSLFSFYRSYLEERTYLLEESQRMFQRAVQEDTERRIKELGSAYNFTYLGNYIFEKEMIEITSKDTTLRIRNNVEEAKLMSPQEKSDFCRQCSLSLKKPIQASLLDSTFQALLHRKTIPAQTGIRYTFMDKTEYSPAETSSFHSFTPLKEIVLGPNRTMVLQAFVRIPVSYIASETLASNIPWVLLLVVFWGLAIVAMRKKPEVAVLPPQETSKGIIHITETVLFDKTHGALHYQGNLIKLANQRLQLFCILLEHKEYFIETNTLKAKIWPEGNVSKDAITTTAKRLKEDLAPIPELTIESARGQGYRLHQTTVNSRNK